MSDEQKPEEGKVPEVTETPAPEVKEERPEENYKAELARKNARLAELEAKLSAQEEKKPKYDNTSPDIANWDDNSLKLLRNSKDPAHTQYHEKVEDILLERKFKAMQAREYEHRRKEESNQRLKEEYPEALDSSSEFGSKVEKIMREYDLDRTPAGRLAAAKIAAAEGKNSVKLGQKKESDRVASVKKQMVDGDRPKPTDAPNPNKSKELKDKLMDTRNPDNQVDAISQILKDRGMTQKDFFKK